ncbi:MAG TPA: uroporphyrinogen decarboxylase family protein [Candidatus Brocadiia bacterium]|nr:uroporphyrinogen decarboxylase family protein [Candidatus Brocadiia bacterium]
MMTSRERLLTALDHREPDRVPIDLGGNQTGIHKFAYQKLINLLGLKEEVVIMDLVQQLAKPSETVLERLGVDTRYVSAGGAESFKGGVVRRERGGQVWNDFTDEFGVTWSMPDNHPYYYDISHSPLAGKSLKQIREYPFPKGDDPSRFAGLRERALKIRQETPYPVISGISGVVYEICWYMRGLENLFTDMIEQPDILEAIIDRTLEFWMGWFRLFLDEAGDVVDVIMIGDDLAGQDGPLYMPRVYRSIVKPRQKQLVQYIRSHTKARIWYHTCGSAIEYIPDLLDNGIDILNPVQISARGMYPTVLKAKYGKRLSFWGGGIDAQHVLPKASPAEIRQHVRRNIEAFKPGGGYVFNNVHNIQADVPPENVIAMFDAAREFGAY